MKRLLPLAILLALSCSAVRAQGYPVKPMRVVIGGSPGSNADIFFRITAGRMGSLLGQQLVVDYRPGAGGAIGAGYTVKTPPDGYTVIMVAAGFVINPALTKTLPFDPARDFTFISPVVTYPLVIAVKPDSRFASVADLVAYARANPRKLNYATPGVGTLYHLAVENFSALSGNESTHVPFRGGSEPVTLTWTMEQARKAGLGDKGTWRAHPAAVGVPLVQPERRIARLRPPRRVVGVGRVVAKPVDGLQPYLDRFRDLRGERLRDVHAPKPVAFIACSIV